MAAYSCTICKRPVSYDGSLPELYPFCCERCKLVDLGLWFRGAYSIERSLDSEEVSEPESRQRPED